MAGLRIFSYLPNPRVWKATIAGRLCGVEVELRGAAPGELRDWLWDFDARPLTAADRAGDTAGVAAVEARTGFGGRLFKTEAFLAAHPFGTVPAAFSPDGATGIFESNSIMRAVARLGGADSPLYGGGDPCRAARIDGFLDASLIFARDSQIYLLSFRGDGPTAAVQAAAARAFATWMTGIERALAAGAGHIAGPALTLADICFVCEFTLFSRERAQRGALARLGLEPILPGGAEAFPRALAHYAALRAHPAFAPDLEPYLATLETDAARANGG